MSKCDLRIFSQAPRTDLQRPEARQRALRDFERDVVILGLLNLLTKREKASECHLRPFHFFSNFYPGSICKALGV